MTTLAVKERPILFSAPMVRALLDGRKTQTRRIVKPQPTTDGYWWNYKDYSASGEKIFRAGMPFLGGCPYGQPGDRLWVRETFAMRSDVDHVTEAEKAKQYALYRADDDEGALENAYHDYGDRWRPSIHMPRVLSRIDLEITGVRVERLNEISGEDAEAEGLWYCEEGDAAGFWSLGPDWPKDVWGEGTVECFMRLWESINGPDSWSQNPWVWVVDFERITP